MHPLLTIHCVAHRQHLVAQNIDVGFSDVLQLVIKTVKKLKSNSLSELIHRQLYLDNNDDYVWLLYHVEVRWLWKCNCIVYFVESVWHNNLFVFQNSPLISSKCDIFFLTTYSRSQIISIRYCKKRKIFVNCKSSITTSIFKMNNV